MFARASRHFVAQVDAILSKLRALGWKICKKDIKVIKLKKKKFFYIKIRKILQSFEISINLNILLYHSNEKQLFDWRKNKIYDSWLSFINNWNYKRLKKWIKNFFLLLFLKEVNWTSILLWDNDKICRG